MSGKTTFILEISFSIKGAKLSRYLLNAEHPDGGSKARFFLARGFDQDSLAFALLAHADHVVERRPTPYGLRIRCEGPLTAPDGTTPLVRSIWEIPPDEVIAGFITAYPL